MSLYDDGGPGHPSLRPIDYARWFISLRWIAIVVAGVLSLLATRVLHYLPADVAGPLLGLVGLLALLNLLYLHLLRRGPPPAFLVPLQAYADLVVLTLLIHFSGGIENPLVLLMIFHVIIAGITLPRRSSYAVALGATVLVALMAWAEALALVPHYTLRLVPHFEQHGHLAHAAHDPRYAGSFVALYGMILFLTAFFVTTLAERLRQKERQLAVLARREQTQRQLLERALETTGTGLCVYDTKGDVLLTNQRWTTWFAAGTPLAGRARALLAAPAAAPGGPEVRVAELEAGADATGNETGRTYQITTAPLTSPDGDTPLVVQLAQDVTDQKAAQAQMLRAGQLAAVGELAGQVAHEVNNPIAIISAKARLLLADHEAGLSPRTRSELEKMVHLADRVAHIAKGLLSYCRPSTAPPLPHDVSLPIRRALALIEQRARNAGIDIADRMPPRLPAVNANAQEIEQVFLNLFLNALDAMPEGGRLTLAAETTGPWLHLHVEDTGTGMPPEVRERIFEPFFTTKPEGKGTGLGLSICHGLIQHYGGRIEVASTPGQGTRFTIILPLHAETEAPHA